MKKWTLEELSKHLEINSKDTYSMAVPMAALYKKLYGKFPKFGLSGEQAEFADQIVDMLPDPEES